MSSAAVVIGPLRVKMATTVLLLQRLEEWQCPHGTERHSDEYA